MKTLRINVKDKIATYFQRDGVIVCGNKGYTIVFTFDEEWDEYTTKTARFVWNGKYYDKQFTDNECEVPVINDTTEVTVGVYAGDLKTTTPAEIPCLISILCGNPEVIEGNIKEYRDIAQQAAEEAQQAAKEAKQAATAIVYPSIDVEEIEGGHRLTINDADGEKNFDVMDGADGEGNGLTPEQLEQFNTLVKWHADSTYTEMTVSISPKSSTYEIGSTKDITFTWSFKVGTKTAELSSLTFRGAVKAVTLTSEKVTDISSTSSYTVRGTRADGNKEPKEATANVYFYNKYYFGYGTDPDTVDSAFIKTLTAKSALSGSRPKFTEVASCADGNYIWLAYPSRLGASSFKMNGFNGGFKDVQTVSFTNNSGYTESYYVYRSVEPSLGSIEVQVL